MESLLKLNTVEPISTILDIQNLSYTYDKKNLGNIINNINFSMNQHEIIAIAGPNGAGKTTFLKLLIGLLKPQTGKIFINGTEVINPRELSNSIGFVFQNPDEQVFFPHVEEDIAFGLRNLGTPENEIDEKVHTVMHQLKITYLSGRTFFSLSFGEKKKVSIAGVVVTYPKIIILDEPTIGLDPWSKKDIVKIILDLAKDTSIILATHDFELLQQVNRILFLWEGKFREFENFKDFENFSAEFVPTKE